MTRNQDVSCHMPDQANMGLAVDHKSQLSDSSDRYVDLVPRAHAPNVGYLAQAFELASAAAFDAAVRASRDMDVEFVAEPETGELPGLGRRRHAMVRNPGGGALQWLLGPAA